MKRNIYADNAATTRLDEEAFEAMKPFLLDDYGNASQPYSFSKQPKQAIKKAREDIANFIGASAEEIFFTSCGTESDNWAIKGFSQENKKRVIITSSIEHHAILNACKDIENTATIIKLPVNTHGIASKEQLSHELKRINQTDKSNTLILVSIMTANNEIGTVQPIKELAEIAHSFGALFHTDAVQAIGHIDIDVKSLGIDMLSASAHKFNGPKGIGFLYIKHGTHIKSFINGGAQEKGLRAGTENVAAIVGMATALKNNIVNLSSNSMKLQALEKRLYEKLKATDLDFKWNGSNIHIPGNISLSFKDCDGEMILHRMDLKGIYISTGSACDGNNSQVSHVIKAIRVPENYAKGTIRISLGKENTAEDVDYIVSSLSNILKYNK